MPGYVLFHNPRCSKSRAARALLDEHGVDAVVIEYLKDPPDRATLERIVGALAEPAALVRAGDPRFAELGLDAAGCRDAAAVVDLLTEHPELMERPVLLRGDAAVIGRPPERVLELVGTGGSDGRSPR